MIASALAKARTLVVARDDEAARHAYLGVLQLDPTHLCALTELGALAHDGGYLSAAREAYRQAVHCHPASSVARAGYGDLLRETGDPAGACVQYQAALAIDTDLPKAHQGLAWALSELGRDPGEHWCKGFTGQAVVRRRYRGDEPGIRLLLLVAAVGGNISTKYWIDNRIYDVTAIYADFFDPADPMPPHALIVNAIGDADCCRLALMNATRIVAHSAAAVINPPVLVAATGRENNAARLRDIPGVVTAAITRLSNADLVFPLLLRSAGYHTGQHFLCVETPEHLAAAAASLPGGDPLAISYLDARGADGMARKYRVMFIDGQAYPLHLAISADWKVHYFTAAMASEPAFRAEEQRFLDDMPGVLGQRAMQALAAVQVALGLDYAGVDFALTADGSLLVFEANATMVINPPEPGSMWDYRRPAATAALTAARRMLVRRCAEFPAVIA